MGTLKIISAVIVLLVGGGLLDWTGADSKILHLEPGTDYVYSYSGWTETSLSPHSSRSQDHDELRGLMLNATVTVKSLSPCEILLELSEVQLSGEGNVGLYANELIREPLRASMQGGRMETLCPTSSITPTPLERWALNVKRGVLSALQLSMKKVPEVTSKVTIHESDVSGTCRTEYEAVQLEDSLLVTRKKDLTLCTGRTGTSYRNLFATDVPVSRPLLRGDQECIQTVHNGRVELVRCREYHVFQPFSNGDEQGATTRVEQVLVLEQVNIGKVPKLELLPANHRRTSLMYEHGSESEIATSLNEDDALAVVTSLLKEMEQAPINIHRSSAKQFDQLVKAMRILTKQQLTELATGSLMHSEMIRELILNALPALDTTASAAVMITLYINRVNQTPLLRHWLNANAAPWFASLATSRHPNPETLQATLDLLHVFEQGRIPHHHTASVVLGVSGFTHSVCSALPDCTQIPAVREVVTVLERIIADTWYDDWTRILAMKGLGNVGVMLSAEPVLRALYQNTSASIEMRLAAIGAFRRTPCPPSTINSSFLSLYANANEDVEVRIAAYLEAVRCPSPALIQVVKRTLYSETVNQVGSFVWTHLTNSQESSSKARRTLRALLANAFLQNKFSTDARQFSRNYEASRYFELLGMGASVDANLIFSTKSYLPRSAMVNLTIDLFGESVNLLEFGGRAEGMEPLLEKLLSKHAPENVPLGEMLRNKREDREFQNVLNVTKHLRQQDSEPHAEAYVRILGNEVSFSELTDLLETAGRFDLNPSIILNSLLQRKEHEFSHSMKFIDAMQVVPTTLGLPLKISVNGTARVQLGFMMDTEISHFGTDFKGTIAPSANIALTGIMAVGNQEFTQGIKFEAMLHTHTATDVTLNLSNGGKLRLQAKMPAEKQTFVEMTSERFLFNNNRISKVPDLSNNRETYTDCTGKYTEDLFGVKICSELSYPNATMEEDLPHFPLTGDARLNIYMEKTDPDFTAYDFSTSWAYVPKQKCDFGITYDRVGSNLQTRRRVVQLVFDRKLGIARATLELPHKQAEVALSWDSADLQSAELQATYNRVSVAKVTAKLAHQAKVLPQKGTREPTYSGKFAPDIKFSVQGLPEFSLKGDINYVTNYKVSAELCLEGFTQQGLCTDVGLSRDNVGSFDARMKLSTPWINFDFKGGAKLLPNSLGLHLNGKYTAGDEQQYTTDIAAKHNWNVQGLLRRDYLHVRTQFSQWPILSGQITAEGMTSSGYLEMNVRAELDQQEWNFTQRFQSSGVTDVWYSCSFVCPHRNISFLIEHRHKVKDHSFSTTSRLQVDPSRRIDFHLDLRRNPGDGVSATMKSSLLWPGVIFSDGNGPFIDARLSQNIPGEYIAQFKSQMVEHQEPYAINANYVDGSSMRHLRYVLHSEISGMFGFSSDKPFIVDAKLSAESRHLEANASLGVGEETKVLLSTRYELMKLDEPVHKLNTTLKLGATGVYTVLCDVINTEETYGLMIDALLSKRMMLDSKLTGNKFHTAIFWDKDQYPDKNVTVAATIMNDEEEGMKVFGSLVFPEHQIEVKGAVRKILGLQRNRDGVEVMGDVSWWPGRGLHVKGSWVGSLQKGIELNAVFETEGLPALGVKHRHLEITYTPQGDARSTNFYHAQSTLTYAWRAEEDIDEHNVILIAAAARIQDVLSLSIEASSSEWNDKHVELNLNTAFRNWSSFEGHVKGGWGSDLSTISWEWYGSSGASFLLNTPCNDIPNIGASIKLSENDKDDPRILRHYVSLTYMDDTWEASLRKRRQEIALPLMDTSLKYDSAELEVHTPLEYFRDHLINVRMEADTSNMKLDLKILTPLIGDYTANLTFTNETTESKNYGLKFILFNADTTTLMTDFKLELIDNIFAAVKIDTIAPKKFDIKSQISLVRKDTELNSRNYSLLIYYENNKHMLHNLDIQFYKDTQYEDQIDISFNLLAYSYLLLENNWHMALKHSGTRNKHITTVKVNQFFLDHTFEFSSVSNLNFMLSAGTPDKMINATFRHDEASRLYYYVTVMKTDLLLVEGDLNEGIFNINLMSNLLQIHSKFNIDDELATTTKIMVDATTIATATSRSYIKYNNEHSLDALIIIGSIESGQDVMKMEVNMDGFRQLTCKIDVKYRHYRVNFFTDLGSLNYAVLLKYSGSVNDEFNFEAFLKTGVENEALVSVIYGEFDFKTELKARITEDGEVEINGKANGSFDDGAVFPLTLQANVNIQKMSFKVFAFDKNHAGISLTSELTLRETLKHIRFRAELPGYNDEFVNFHAKYEAVDGTHIDLLYEKKRIKYQAKISLTNTVINAKFETPIQGYNMMTLKMGYDIKTEPKRAVLELMKDDYSVDASVLVESTKDNTLQLIAMAKTSDGMEFESLFTRIQGPSHVDCQLNAIMNNQRVESGILFEYSEGNLNVTTNVTVNGKTARLNADIRSFVTNKSFRIVSEFEKKTYHLFAFSSGDENKVQRHGFTVQTPSRIAEFEYEKTVGSVYASMRLQNHTVNVRQNGTVQRGSVQVSHATLNIQSSILLDFDFRGKALMNLVGTVSELPGNAKPTMEPQALKLKLLGDPRNGKVHFHYQLDKVEYLFDATYQETPSGTKETVTLISPHHEKISANMSYKFAKSEKAVVFHMEYGADFYHVEGMLSVDAAYTTSVHVDLKSSVKHFEHITFSSVLEMDGIYVASANLVFPFGSYNVTIKFDEENRYEAKLKTTNNEYDLKYWSTNSTEQFVLKINEVVMIQAEFTLDNNHISGILNTPYERFQNVSLLIGFSDNIPTKNIEILKNGERLFKAHVYTTNNQDSKQGNGILATFYQGNDAFIFDTKYSFDNPIFVSIEQQESTNETKQILHLNLNLSSGNAASGEVFFQLPFEPHKKFRANAVINISENNAELKATYTFDGETKHELSLTYNTFIDNYNKYNIETHIKTPWKNYKKLSLKMQSSDSETIVNFESPFIGYENIKIVSIHQLSGNKKEFVVQYQNMQKRIFYLKALFINDEFQKMVDLETRSPILSGQALIHCNSSLLYVKLEHEKIIISEIKLDFETKIDGREYEFAFRTAEAEYRLQISFRIAEKVTIQVAATSMGYHAIKFEAVKSPSGHFDADLQLFDSKYSISGDIDEILNSVQVEITSDKTQSRVNFSFRSTGFCTIESTLLAEKFLASWDIKQMGASFNLSYGQGWAMNYYASESLVDITLLLLAKEYSFKFGQVSNKGWPNIEVSLIWDSKPVLDFQHQFLTDAHLTLIRTRFSTPYLGNHKHMKFEVTLKTKDTLMVQAEFKWRPKDLTIFKFQLELENMKALATLEFKSPFSIDFSFRSGYDFSSPIKSVEVLYELGEKLHFNAKLVPSGTEQTINITLISPIQGYKYINLEGSYKKNRRQHVALLQCTREKFVSDIQVRFENNDMNAVIKTDDMRWILNGHYDLNEGTHSVTGTFQWGGVSDVCKTEILYKPGSKLFIEIKTPNTNFAIDMNHQWTAEKKSVSFIMKRGEISAEMNIQLVWKNGIYLLVGNTKSGSWEVCQISAALDMQNENLRGALQLYNSTFSLNATRIGEKRYLIALENEVNEQLELELVYHGSLNDGLKIELSTSHPTLAKLRANGDFKFSNGANYANIIVTWNDDLRDSTSVTYSMDSIDGTTIKTKINTNALPNFETSVWLGERSFSVVYKNMSDSIAARFEFFTDPKFGVHALVKHNDDLFEYVISYNPSAYQTVVKAKWPRNHAVDFSITLKPGQFIIFLNTSFVPFNNIKLSGKHSQNLSNSMYEVSSYAEGYMDDLAMSIEGNIFTSWDNYGIAGIFKWGQGNEMRLSGSVRQNKTITFELFTPLKGLPHIFAEFEVLQNRLTASGLRGYLETPFLKLPKIKFMFNRVDHIVEAEFAFDTTTYKEISISTKFSNKYNYLFVNISTPFNSQVKRFVVDARSSQVLKRGASVKIVVALDDDAYELENYFTSLQGKFDSHVLIKGPKAFTYEIKFGGKFNMDFTSKADILAYVNHNYITLNYDFTSSLHFIGKIWIPTLRIWPIPSELELLLNHTGSLNGKLSYVYGLKKGSVLVKNVMTNNSLETIAFLSLPDVLRYPLQIKLNAVYVNSRLQCTGYASYMAEHRLELNMIQSAFTTIIEANLSSGFFKSAKTFSLSMSSNTISTSFNEEIKVTGQKKGSELVLTLNQLRKNLEHILTYKWELSRSPKIEITLQSPLLSAKQASLTAVYMGLTQGINLEFVSGTEKMNLDFGAINENDRKELYVIIGNRDNKLLQFSSNMRKISAGYEAHAILSLLGLQYIAKANYSVEELDDVTSLGVMCQFSGPYIFPFDSLLVSLRASNKQDWYHLEGRANFDDEHFSIDTELDSERFKANITTSLDYFRSILIQAISIKKQHNGLKSEFVDLSLGFNDKELFSANVSATKYPYNVVLEIISKSSITGFREFELKVSMPTDDKYQLTAGLNFMTDCHYSVHLSLVSRDDFTNLQFRAPDLLVSVHLTPNQGEFSYKSPANTYDAKLYSKHSGQELHSEIIVTSGDVELIRAGLYGTVHNRTEFYVLMSVTTEFEFIKSASFYVGGEGSEIRFGAEHESISGKRFYAAILRHHFISIEDIDFGFDLENDGTSILNIKFVHTKRPDFYVLLAQKDSKLIKVSVIKQNRVHIGTATLRFDEHSYDISAKLIKQGEDMTVDFKATSSDNVYQIGGFYNKSTEYFKLSLVVDSPFTNQNNMTIELAQPNVVFFSVSRNNSELILVDLNSMKERSIHIIANYEESAFQLTKHRRFNDEYEITSFLSIRNEYVLHFHTYDDGIGEKSYNVTVKLPNRSVSAFCSHVNGENKRGSEAYLSWETLDKRIGYAYEIFHDNYKQNIKINVEIPSRAVEFKTHTKIMEIGNDLNGREYGIQFNWDKKTHQIPVTLVGSVRYNPEVAYLYLVFAHPVLNRSFVVDGELRRINTQETHIASRIGTVLDGIMDQLFRVAVNISGDSILRQYQLLLLHPTSGVNHSVSLSVDSSRGMSAQFALTDHTSNRSAEGKIVYTAALNAVELGLVCEELEINLLGKLNIDRHNGRYGAELSGQFDQTSDPVALAMHLDRLDGGMRLTSGINLAQSRSYEAEGWLSPRVISLQLVHFEYGTANTAAKAVLALNDSETLFVSGGYRHQIWANITEDAHVLLQQASLASKLMSARLKSLVNEDIFERLSNASLYTTCSHAFNSIVKHTQSQWTLLKQDFNSIKRIPVMLFNQDAFYVRTIYHFVADNLRQGTYLMNAGILRLRQAFKHFSFHIMPDFMHAIYRSTIEPLVRGIHHLAPKLVVYISQVRETWKYCYNYVKTSYRSAITYTKDVALQVAKVSAENVFIITNWVSETKGSLESQFVVPWLRALYDTAIEVERWFTHVNDIIDNLPSNVERYFMDLEETQSIIRFYQTHCSFLEEIRLAEMLSDLREMMQSWYASLVADLNNLFGEQMQYVTMVLDVMKGTYDELLIYPPVVYVRMVYARTSQKLAWMWDYYHLEKALEQFIIAMSDELITLFRTWSDEAVEEYGPSIDFNDPSYGKFIQYNADSFEATVSLPFKWRRFDQLPEMNAKVEERFSNLRYSVMDKMYHLATETNDWRDTMQRILLPPFSSSALVASNGHIITFDGHHYKVKNELCGSYLLAADYYSNKFSVILNYGSEEQSLAGPLHSVTVFTPSGTRLSIAMDVQAKNKHEEDGYSRITLDNVKVELPIKGADFEVTREGQMVNTKSSGGMELRCNIVAGLCTLELPGWFHGRVAGLAGSLDRESGNDMVTPNGDFTNSILELFRHWKVSSGSNCEVAAAPITKGKTKGRSSGVCRRLFQNIESPLQPCFKRLDPTPFRLMCNQDTATVLQNRAAGFKEANETRSSQCLAAEAYVEQCKFVGMELSMPTECVRCRLTDDQILPAGEAIIFDAKPTSLAPPPPNLADVVFVLERPATGAGSCLEGSDLSDLPAKLESMLRASQGINSTRFALVTFGANSPPAIHTLEGHVWNGKRSLQTSLNELRLEPSDTPATDRDLMTVLLTASSKLSFRAGASKTLVLAPCSSCERSEDTAMIFAEASSLLLEADVRLHVLQRDDMPFRRTKRKQAVHQGNVNPVMGLDAHGAYTGRRVKGTSIPLPSKAIMRQLSIQKDLCTPLALESNGTLFSASRLMHKRLSEAGILLSSPSGDGKRKWLDVWSRRVASSGRPSSCQACDCLPYIDGGSRVSCQPCVSPTIQRFLKEWEDFLDAAALEDLGGEDDDDDTSGSHEDMLDAVGLSPQVQEELEAERRVFDRLKDMIEHGHLPEGH